MFVLKKQEQVPLNNNTGGATACRRFLCVSCYTASFLAISLICLKIATANHEMIKATQKMPHDSSPRILEDEEMLQPLSTIISFEEENKDDLFLMEEDSKNSTVVQFLEEILPNSTWEAIENNNASAQARALDWILQDPSVESYDNSSNVEEDMLLLVVERFALATFYFSLGGERWNTSTHWLSYNHSVCDWYMDASSPVEVLEGDILYMEAPSSNSICGWHQFSDKNASSSTNSNGTATTTTITVKHLWLPHNNLQGTLPMELSLLTHLETIHLPNNSITGTLPVALGSLTDIKQMSLSNNQLVGTIPNKYYQQWTRLTLLDLSFNQIVGTIPSSEIGNWKHSIQQLHFGNNRMEGPLPSELGLLSNLQYLNYARNRRVNDRYELPSEMGRLTNLQYLLLEYSFIFRGAVPTEIIFLTNLKELDIKGNQFTGTLPTEMGQLLSLERLELTQNAFTGPLPFELGNLQNMTHFNAELNSFSGILPLSIMSLSHLVDLLLCNNLLSGTIPSEMGNMRSLADLHLCGNQMSGSIPPSIQPLTNLYHWNVKDNFLTGTLPGGEALGSLTKMESLEVNNNALSGPLPSEIGQWPLLKILRLDQNQFTGTMPSEIGQLSGLEALIMYQNKVTGSIPPEVCELRELELNAFVCDCPTSDGQGVGVYPDDDITSLDALLELEGNCFTTCRSSGA